MGDKVVVKTTSPTGMCLGRLLLQIAVRRRRGGRGPVHGQLTLGMEPASAWSVASCSNMGCLRGCWTRIVEKCGHEAHELFEKRGGVFGLGY